MKACTQKDVIKYYKTLDISTSATCCSSWLLILTLYVKFPDCCIWKSVRFLLQPSVRLLHRRGTQHLLESIY